MNINLNITLSGMKTIRNGATAKKIYMGTCSGNYFPDYDYIINTNDGTVTKKEPIVEESNEHINNISSEYIDNPKLYSDLIMNHMYIREFKENQRNISVKTLAKMLFNCYPFDGGYILSPFSIIFKLLFPNVTHTKYFENYEFYSKFIKSPVLKYTDDVDPFEKLAWQLVTSCKNVNRNNFTYYDFKKCNYETYISLDQLMHIFCPRNHQAIQDFLKSL